MPTKTKHKKSSSQHFSLDTKKKPLFHHKLTSPSKIVFKLKKKLSNRRQNAFPNNIQDTPSYIIGECEAANGQQVIVAQYSMPCLRSKKGSHITNQGQPQIVKKNQPQYPYNMTGSDYHGAQTSRFNSQLKFPRKNNKGSTLNTQICYEYGCSQLSNQKSNLKKQSSKSKNKFPDQSQIQRLLNKYTKHIEKPPTQGHSTQKKQYFRTLSTDDKSLKKFQFSKKTQNRRKKQSTINKVISIISPQHIKIQNNKYKSLKTKKPKSSKQHLLPDYFGCLSINKVESKIQKLNFKDEKILTKKIKPSTNKTSRGTTYQKSEQNLQMTKAKEYIYHSKEVKLLCNKEYQNLSQRPKQNPNKIVTKSLKRGKNEPN